MLYINKYCLQNLLIKEVLQITAIVLEVYMNIYVYTLSCIAIYGKQYYYRGHGFKDHLVIILDFTYSNCIAEVFLFCFVMVHTEADTRPPL